LGDTTSELVCFAGSISAQELSLGAVVGESEEGCLGMANKVVSANAEREGREGRGGGRSED